MFSREPSMGRKEASSGARQASAGASALLSAVASVLVTAAAVADPVAEEFRVKREGPFEFAEKPVVTRRGDTVTIAFETKAFCDVTVAIEDDAGKILRHFASGVLGPNAPMPFQKNSRKQVIVWDGKDDHGAYVEDYDKVAVRVSLGLAPRFERHFFWSPHRRISNVGHAPTLVAPPPFVAQPEGVYVFDGCMVDHLRLFDHRGNYVKTLYPFAPGTLDRLVGVKTHLFPQTGLTLPLKGGNYQSTLLTSGTNCGGNYLIQLFGFGATAMAIRNGRIALVAGRLNRLATDGTTGGLPLEGPQTGVSGPRVYGMTDQDAYLPRSAALSPDGKTLYITGWNREGWNPNWRIAWVQGVGRIDFEKGEKLEPFAGVLTLDPKKGGADPAAFKFKSPVSVDTDQEGRVYVADRYNHAIQVFDPSGRHLKSIPVPGGESSPPSDVVVNQRNGDIFVFAWYLDCVSYRVGAMHPRQATLFHYGPFDQPDLKAKYPLPIPDQSRRGQYGGDQLQGREFRATIDPWAPGDVGPYVWLIQAHTRPLRMYRIDQEKSTLVLVRDFAQEARAAGPGHLDSMFLYAPPKTGELWAGAGQESTVVDPATGRMRSVRLPFAAHDLAFDMQGQVYLRDFSRVVRYEVMANDQFREVPFDYGEDRRGAAAALSFTSSIHGTGQVLSVSPRGHVLASVYTGQVPLLDRRQSRDEEFYKTWKPYKPVLFEGRGGRLAIRVWDRYGRVLYEDLVLGTSVIHGAFMDRDDNVYLAAEATRAGYFDPLSCTMVKVKPASKVLSTKAVLPFSKRPERPHETDSPFDLGSSWWEGAEWFYGGIGYGGKLNSTCHCTNFNPAHDYFARSFVPELQHCSVAVLDTAGNLVVRIGRYGNVDDGVPLIESEPKQPHRRELGGDEVALFRPTHLGTHTDQRLYVADGGNGRIVSVKLDYHATERVALKDARNSGG